MKNQKQLTIKAPQGQEIDMKFFNETKQIRFIDEQPEILEFPKTWDIKNKTKIYFVTADSNIQQVHFFKDKHYRNSYPTQKLAEQSIIFAQLILIREEYRRIELHNNPNLRPIDWCDSAVSKYAVSVNKNNLVHSSWLNMHAIFSFLLPSTRNEFMKNFGDMILECKDLLG